MNVWLVRMTMVSTQRRLSTASGQTHQRDSPGKFVPKNVVGMILNRRSLLPSQHQRRLQRRRPGRPYRSVNIWIGLKARRTSTPVLARVATYGNATITYRIAKLIGLLGDKNLSISTYVDMVLGEHLKKYDEAMDAVMKMKFDEMQAQISNEE